MLIQVQSTSVIRKRPRSWLSELVHFYDAFKDTNVDIDLFNITGGNTPIDPVSLSPFMLDNTTKAYYNNEHFMDMLKYSQPISEAQPDKYDAVYFTGGHGVMYDFRKINLYKVQ